MLEVEVADSIGGTVFEASFEVAAGELLAVAGPSGCGKTTLLRVIAGLRRPASGTVRCAGRTWLDAAAGIDLPPEDRAVGFAFQEYALFPRMTAAGNVAFALHGMRRGERRAKAEQLLDSVGLSGRGASRPASLSGGERQRLALARAIARGPSLLLLDEPVAALDAETAAGAIELIRKTALSLSIPCVLVAHGEDGLNAADRVLRLGD